MSDKSSEMKITLFIIIFSCSLISLSSVFSENLLRTIKDYIFFWLGFPGGSEYKASACNAGDLGLIPGWGRSPGEGNGNPLQYSCLENPMDGEAWWATVHGVAKSQTRLRDLSFTFLLVTNHSVGYVM